MTEPEPSGTLRELDSQTYELIHAEHQRQRDKIIMIPSESWTPPAVREALGSVFTSVYAEGYPRPAMRWLSPKRLADLDEQLAQHRRYADWRFYKGTEFADLVESLAGRRAAECLATELYPATKIFANVQPLSGAAANLAVYEAFVQPGGTVMGLDLTEGGHLTHGSEFNVTGKRYRIVSYASNRQTGRLDYDRIMQLAKQHRPQMIIAGFTSFPWQPDWARFRSIADEVGAILFADIAHTAGMVIGGVYPNPIGYADVVAFTTHKTLCGPRGAIILSTDPDVAARVDNAIFPGEQGGPHVNKFAAHAVALQHAQSREFRELQDRIVSNASHLAQALADQGLTLAYGGTDTHLCLVDLKPLENTTGFTMMGEIAARILDLVGIVCNKNTIPGDTSAGDATGIRLGTPWASQRGMGKDEMQELARIIAYVLCAIEPFSYEGITGDLSRGKLPLSVLQRARGDVGDLMGRLNSDGEVRHSSDGNCSEEGRDPCVLRVCQGRAQMLLDEATTAAIADLEERQAQHTLLFDEHGELISEAVVMCDGEDVFRVVVPRPQGNDVRSWLEGLADGYVLFDRDDIFRKVQGPAVIGRMQAQEARGDLSDMLPDTFGNTVASGTSVTDAHDQCPELFAVEKPYFIGQSHLDLGPAVGSGDPKEFVWEPTSPDELKQTPLHGKHKELGARFAPFAGWHMPVWYSSALEEHGAVRERAGLFDLGHMGVFAVEGAGATRFLNGVTSNYADWLAQGDSQYAYLLDCDGNVIDDVMVYRRGPERYMMVVNAVNEEKDWAWLNGVNRRAYPMDRDAPLRHLGPKVRLRNLKTERGILNVALQGPRSRRILGKLVSERERVAIGGLERTQFTELMVNNRQLLVARTGYTGEEQGYEIYAATKDARWLWDALLEAGTPLGLKPCGLACRDSTRTEAGLPLYGHELAGPYKINPTEAGFAPYVKLHKPFFVGRRACVRDAVERTREVVRFQVTESGVRSVREGSAAVDRNGTFLGRVTSCVNLGDRQVGMALFERIGTPPDTAISILNAPRRNEAQKASVELAPGDRVAVSVPARTMTRFPEPDGPTFSGGE